MNGAVFVFTRDIVGESGQRLRQAVTVFAEDFNAANRVLAHDLASLRAGSNRKEAAFARLPDWRVEEIALDSPKVLTSLVT
jgi:hypothetical protein